jgi:aldose 1-epimerase
LKFPPRAGVCLETQGYPDSPNRPEFPTSILKAGERYHQQTTWQFYLP